MINTILLSCNYRHIPVSPREFFDRIFGIIPAKTPFAKKMYLGKDRTGNITMAENPTCAQCEKETIGVQSFGCRSAGVCEDHAYSILPARKPGEKYSSGECSFQRFGSASVSISSA
jgi:hypothetical protein